MNRVIDVHFSNDPISFDSIKLCNNQINYSSQIPGQLLITLSKVHHCRKRKMLQTLSVKISISFSVFLTAIESGIRETTWKQNEAHPWTRPNVIFQFFNFILLSPSMKFSVCPLLSIVPLICLIFQLVN